MNIKVCSCCGKEYVYHGRGSGDHTKYCSDECKSVALHEQWRRSWWKNDREKQKARYKGDEKRIFWLKHSVPEGFTYLNDWEPGKTEASFRCNKHGTIVVRNLKAIMMQPSGSIRCQECRKEWLRERERGRTSNRKYGNMDAWKAVLEERKEQRKKKTDEKITVLMCQICGKEFRSNRKDRKTCGGECARIYARVRSDRRIRPEFLVDKNITLKRLYERDSGICYLCGGVCDWNDKHIGENGIMIYGDKHPSKDHVIPLAKGGLHSWENVKLAHLRCNLNKSDGVFPNLKPDGERLKKLGFPPKRTEQYSLNGLLIASYDSAAEAARQTGFKSKQIQNCARGECKTYRGYIWRYS